MDCDPEWDVNPVPALVLSFLLAVGTTPAFATGDTPSIDRPSREGTILSTTTNPRAADGQSINRVLAVVVDAPVTLKDYKDRYGDTSLQKIKFKRLIEERLVREAARDMDILIRRSQVRQYVDQQIATMTSKMGAQAFERSLREQGLNQQQFRDQMMQEIKTQMLRGRVLNRVLPDLNMQPDSRAMSLQVRAKLALFEDSGTAWSVYRKLQESPTEKNWNRLFETYSQKLHFMNANGNLGWFHWGKYHSSIEYRLFTLPPYGFSRPFTVLGRYAIVYHTGYRMVPDPESSSQEVLNAYTTYLQRSQRERLVDRLRKRYTIWIPESIRQEVNLEDADPS